MLVAVAILEVIAPTFFDVWVQGVAGIVAIIMLVLAAFATIRHFKLGCAPSAALGLAAMALALLAASPIIHRLRQPPSPPVKAKPELKQLSYRLCGMFKNHPGSERKDAFGIEIDPYNPNGKPVHVDVTNSLLIFDKVPSEGDLSGRGFEVSPQSHLTPQSTIRNIKHRLFYKPPKMMTGQRTGRYHYEFKFGWDKNNATQPFVINGEIIALFDKSGAIIGVPYFNPNGDSDVTFDPKRCKYYDGENPDGAEDSPGEV